MPHCTQIIESRIIRHRVEPGKQQQAGEKAADMRLPGHRLIGADDRHFSTAPGSSPPSHKGAQRSRSVIGVSGIIATVIPAVAIAVPGYYGITFLAGHHGDTMHPAGRNLVGALVLIFGFFVGLVVQSGWYWIVQRIYEAIFA
jgi:hypothetical protein